MDWGVPVPPPATVGEGAASDVLPFAPPEGVAVPAATRVGFLQPHTRAHAAPVATHRFKTAHARRTRVGEVGTAHMAFTARGSCGREGGQRFQVTSLSGLKALFAESMLP